MNKTLGMLAVFLVGVLGIVAYFEFQGKKIIAPVTSFDPGSAAYVIDNAPVVFENGKSGTVTIFDTPARGDLNGDGSSDAALIFVDNSRGSGTFYYVAAALNTRNGTQGTNAILLGDRITPQSIAVADGIIVVHYADRKPNEPMSAEPSIDVTKYFSISNDSLIPASAPTNATSTTADGQLCGGNLMHAPQCPDGYRCSPRPGSHLPVGDVGGICVKN